MHDNSFGNEGLYSPQYTSSTTRLLLEKILICKTLHNFEEGGFSNLGFPSTTWLVHLTQQILSLVRYQKKRKIPTHALCYHILNFNNHCQSFLNKIKHRFPWIFLCSQNPTAVLLTQKEQFQQPIQLQSFLSFLLSQPLQISRPRCSGIPCTHQR